MKKFLYAAVMALTVVFMAGCVAGGSSSYQKGDPQPVIDFDKGTINGIAYDIKTECCWHTKVTTSMYGQSVNLDYYDWGTEFDVKAVYEEASWGAAQTGIKYSYSCTKSSESTYEACEDRNKNL